MKNVPIIFLILMSTVSLYAHHFKGLPHYGYFENYPQTPVDEYLGQAGDFEFFLVIYDFQGFQREDVARPDDIRLFMNVYDLRADKAYSGPLKMEILDDNHVIGTVIKESSEQESLYYYNQKLPQEGHYSLRVRVPTGMNTEVIGLIPFQLSTQKISWAKWIIIFFAIILIIVAVSSRRARIKKDRMQNRQSEI